MAKSALTGWRMRVRGTVQGVGFRPTVYQLAQRLEIRGQVLNDSEGVTIEAWAPLAVLERFRREIESSAPPLARIESISTEELSESGAETPTSFRIVESRSGLVKTAVAADAGTCSECLKEVFDKQDRRYRYPFTNCTHCGPRLSIIRSIPYDRANTSMSAFTMCSRCRSEYENAADRRFHAQPNACPLCGPRVALVDAGGRPLALQEIAGLDAVAAAALMIERGQIVAVKGLGGFHLACDAVNEQAVTNLRQRKKRFAKPFALMAPDIETIKRYCRLSQLEADLLASHQAPIVVLLKNAGSAQPTIASAVAANQSGLGFMLPYTPLHHLLASQLKRPIVLTSGNISDEPQCTDNDDCLQRLSEIADYFLIHDREIVNRLDDSVVKIISGKPAFLRRARGYAPTQLQLPQGFEKAPALIAMGGELKNTFCLLKNGKAIISQHTGDLEEARTNADYKKNIDLYSRLYQHKPERIAVDLHPDYLSSKAGREWGERERLAVDEIQHHHAHIASCLADNGWPLSGGAVLGIALDGLGYGSDGTLWGGEFLLANYTGFSRLATLRPTALLGGAQAMREPWRNTYAQVIAALGWDEFQAQFETLELTRFFQDKPLKTLNAMLDKALQAPLSSSCGRLFDAVAAAVGICRESASYEGQAAVELEAAVSKSALHESTGYEFAIEPARKSRLIYLEPRPMWLDLLQDLKEGKDRSLVAARFHKGLAEAIVQMAQRLSEHGASSTTRTVALSGGVFQNQVLSELVVSLLVKNRFTVLTHNSVPANDGGLSLGEAAISAALHIERQESKER